MLKRLASSLVLAVGIALTATSCGFVMPQATELKYDPDNGVSASVGQVELRNIVVLRSADTDDLGNLVFTAVNNSGNPVQLQIQVRTSETNPAASSVTVTIEPGLTRFGHRDDAQVLLSPGPALGSLTPVFFVYGGETGDLVDIPVLNAASWDFYKGFEPVAPVIPEPEEDDEAESDEEAEEAPTA